MVTAQCVSCAGVLLEAEAVSLRGGTHAGSLNPGTQSTRCGGISSLVLRVGFVLRIWGDFLATEGRFLGKTLG